MSSQLALVLFSSLQIFKSISVHSIIKKYSNFHEMGFGQFEITGSQNNGTIKGLGHVFWGLPFHGYGVVTLDPTTLTVMK